MSCPPAAFGRLCVETDSMENGSFAISQPPSGGCVLKRTGSFTSKSKANQPPSGGCVLKHQYIDGKQRNTDQPPSGGCVLKQEARLW